MQYYSIKRLNALNLFTVLIYTAISTQCVAQGLKENKWQVLFNGVDLSGWEMLNGQHKAYVEDGVIVVTTVPGEPNGFLCTTEDYDDFILELEVNADLLLDNSGIQFRSLSHDGYRDGRVHGYQAQTENRPPHVSQWNGAIYDEARRGWLYLLEDDPVRQKAYIHNQWNRFRIEAIGTSNRIWVNDIPTAHLVDDETLRGFICLQIHGGGLAAERGAQSKYMRDVRIQTDNLNPRPYDDIPVVNLIPNTISGQEEHQGFELLFDGEMTRNWRGVTQPGLPESHLEIDDGAVTVSTSEEAESGDGIAIMMTENQYGPFELKFDFKIHDEHAIVGIEYFFDGDLEKEREAIYGHLALYNKRHRASVTRDLWREWNRAVIKASLDNRVEYWLNDYKILEYQRDSDAPSTGHILLDSYGDSISYRSIKIRELN